MSSCCRSETKTGPHKDTSTRTQTHTGTCRGRTRTQPMETHIDSLVRLVHHVHTCMNTLQRTHTHPLSVQPTQSYSFQGGGGFFFFFFSWALHGGGREDCVWCRVVRWSTLSGVAASDAPGLGMLWHHNGSRLRVQARLSRIYIYIKAANPSSCTAAEGSEARRAAVFTSSSSNRRLCVVSLSFMLLFALKCSQRAHAPL